MKCFKSCVLTDESRSRKSNALDPFEDAVSRSPKMHYDQNGNEVPRITEEDVLNHNESFYIPSNDHVWIRNCEEEVIEPLAGELTGSIPKWLKGTLLRNGPGNLKVGEHTYQHVLDGAALVHRFRIENGEVTYQRRFVQSDTYKKNRVAQRITVSEFGTGAMPDPCQSIFERVSSVFNFNENITDNTNVSVYPFGDEYYTLTETPLMRRIDPNTLETMNKVQLTDYVNIVHHTAHPQVMSDGTVYNIGLSTTQQGPQYNVVCFHPRRTVTDETGNKQELSMFDQATFVASIPCRWKLNPSYMHSFGVTDNYFIIVEQPFTISVAKLIAVRARHGSVANSLKWHKNKSALIHVISRDTGRKIKTFVSETFFFFHIINQFETRDRQYVVLDVCCYRDPKIIELLYIESLKNGTDHEILLGAKALRFVLPMKRPRVDTPPNRNLITIETVHQNLVEQLDSNTYRPRIDHSAKETNCETITNLDVEHENVLQRKPTAYRLPDGNVLVKPELLCDLRCELPRINDSSHLGKEYRYFYAISNVASQHKSATIIKVDTFRKTVKTWEETDVSPSEPIFVAEPNGKNEDDGIVLSSLVWTTKYRNRVGLLILDAATFTEIARVTFDTPGLVPKCLHGWFSLDK